MDRRSQIFDVAETLIRGAGYNAVSFRDIAAELGIKSASLHYHFPKKEDLGGALVHRYADQFWIALAAKESRADTPAQRLAHFVSLYREALMADGRICLCVVLGAEASGLPNPVSENVVAFFETQLNWLTERFTETGNKNSADKAHRLMAELQGAMIIGSNLKDYRVFEQLERQFIGTKHTNEDLLT